MLIFLFALELRVILNSVYPSAEEGLKPWLQYTKKGSNFDRISNEVICLLTAMYVGKSLRLFWSIYYLGSLKS